MESEKLIANVTMKHSDMHAYIPGLGSPNDLPLELSTAMRVRTNASQPGVPAATTDKYHVCLIEYKPKPADGKQLPTLSKLVKTKPRGWTPATSFTYRVFERPGSVDECIICHNKLQVHLIAVGDAATLQPAADPQHQAAERAAEELLRVEEAAKQQQQTSSNSSTEKPNKYMQQVKSSEQGSHASAVADMQHHMVQAGQSGSAGGVQGFSSIPHAGPSCSSSSSSHPVGQVRPADLPAGMHSSSSSSPLAQQPISSRALVSSSVLSSRQAAAEPREFPEPAASLHSGSNPSTSAGHNSPATSPPASAHCSSSVPEGQVSPRSQLRDMLQQTEALELQAWDDGIEKGGML